MAVGSGDVAELSAVAGVRLGATSAHIKYPERLDLLLVEVSDQATVACVFTRNKFCAAPVTI